MIAASFSAQLVDTFLSYENVAFLYSHFTEPDFGSNMTKFANYGFPYDRRRARACVCVMFAQRVTVCCVSYHYHAQIPNVDPLSVAMQPRVNVLASSGMALHQHHLFHLVRLPNHVRVWNATAYRLLAGHKSELAAADDYNLLLRSLFAGKWVEIACVLYVQWRNPAADNFTFKRNALIQFAVHEQWSRWSQRVFEFFDQLAPGEFTPVELVKQVRRGLQRHWRSNTLALCSVLAGVKGRGRRRRTSRRRRPRTR